MTTQAVAPYKKTDRALSFFEPKTFEELKARADVLVKSGILPQTIKTAEAFIAVVTTGRELGLSMMESTRSIYIVQGTPSLRPQTMLALIYKSKACKSVNIVEKQGSCSVTMCRKGGEPYTVTFGNTEALAMQLAGKDNYKKQAAVMYKWRAISACARIVFPDVILGLYTPEEIQPEVEIVNADTPDERVEIPEISSKPDITTGIVIDGKPVKISDLTDDMLQSFVIPLDKTTPFEGFEPRYKGLPMGEVWMWQTGAKDSFPGQAFLKKAEQYHPIEEVRNVIRRYLDLMDPARHEAIPPTPRDTGFEPVDPKAKKATPRQLEALGKICAKENTDLPGLCYGYGIDHATLTEEQAGRIIKKNQAIKR